MTIKNIFNRHSEYRLESILKQNLTPLRIELGGWVRNDKDVFSLEKYDDFVARLKKATGGSPYLKQQADMAREAVFDGRAAETPSIERPELQLLWAATLLCYRNYKTAHAGTPDGKPFARNLPDSELWKQIENSPYAAQELMQHAYYVTESLRRPDTRFQWGAPGSWFYFHPEENHINVDLLISMIGGFEHTRAILFHEIGHSQLTTKFPKTNMALRERMKEIQEQALERAKKKAEQTAEVAKKSGIKNYRLKTPIKVQMTKEEYKEMRMLSAEFQLRHKVVDATENDVVNRYAVNMGNQLAQDYGYSMNNTATTISGYGSLVLNTEKAKKEGKLTPQQEARQKKEEKKKELEKALAEKGDQLSDEDKEKVKKQIKKLDSNAEQRFLNIINIINMAFFKNNHYFPDTEEGWRKVGVEPDLVRITGTGYGKKPADESAKSKKFPHPDFEYLLELCSGPEGLEHLQPKPRDRWYGADYFNKLTDEFADRRCDIAEQIWDLYLADCAEELLEQAEEQIDQEIEQAQNGQSQDGQGQDGQSQDGQGQQGQGQPGQGGQSGQGGGQPDPGGAQPGDDMQPGQGGVNQEGKTVDVDMGDGQGTKEMPDVDMPPETPQGDGAGADADGQDADGQDADGQGKTLQELIDEMKRKMEEAQNADQEQGGDPGQDGDGQDSDGQGAPSPGQDGGNSPTTGQGGEGGEGKSLEELAKGDWSDYAAMVKKLQGPIAQVGRMLKKIQEHQLETYSKRSRDLEQMPEDKEIDRLDRDAQNRLIFKRATGQKIEEGDLNRWQKNKNYKRPTELDIVLMIDGSASMDSGRNQSKASPLEISLLTGTVIYEASKQIDANVYMMLWGSNYPVLIARPGDDRKDIAKRIVAARHGLNSGTDMAASVRKMTKTLADQKHKPGRFGGYTHMIVISDGDIFDQQATREEIDKLYKSSKYFTLDFAIVKSGHSYTTNHKTNMEKLAEEMKVRNPTQKINVVVEGDNNKVPVAIMASLFDKLRSCHSFVAVPQRKKRKGFQRAARQMDIKGPRG